MAVKYFKEANEDNRELTEMRSLETGDWRLESEFEVEGSGVKGDDVKRGEGVYCRGECWNCGS